MNTHQLTCKSVYVKMRDGIRLAVSIWLANDTEKYRDKRPAVVITTRYWRAMASQLDNLEFQRLYYWAAYLYEQGYVLVTVDARGSGASFGSRDSEMPHAEVDDAGEVITWVAQQTWCDGRVATTGTSYSANTTLYSLVAAPSALKLSVCRAPDYDPYRHLVAPGGIVNRWFIEAWGTSTAAQDNNDIQALLDTGYWVPPESGADNVLGVRPVDEDTGHSLSYNTEGSLLAAAVADHKANFNLALANEMTFIENSQFGSNRPFFAPSYQEAIEKNNIPLVVRCGWHDAGTQLGALSLFVSFSNPIQVILGPWNHEGSFLVDPFHPEGRDSNAILLDDPMAPTVKSLDAIFKQDKRANNDQQTCEQFGIVEYFTLGENRWKTTRVWPLPQTKIKRLYLSAEHQLGTSPPASQDGCDQYQVNPNTGTGTNNRWHAQSMEKPIFFPNRQEEDKKLLVYDTPPLENDIEITGHPVVHLWIRSTATDGQFFVYLEVIDPEGQVRMLTEGQLRGLHRKVSDETPPYTMFGPYHSFKEKDAQPLTPGEVAEITFDLYPISVLLKKGLRLRLAIAGADKDVFAPIAGSESPEITVERNSVYGSYIDIPLV